MSSIYEEKMSCGELLNYTESSVTNRTEDSSTFDKVFIFYTYALPTICICGFLGNMMNLVILAGKRIQRMFKASEKSASIGMMALAVADLCFCISAFPSGFLPRDNTYSSRGFLLFYGCFCAAVINIFIMTSTWLTVVMSTERFLAIRHPLKSRRIITLRRSKIVIVFVYVSSALFNIPVFWRYKIEKTRCDDVIRYRVVPAGIDKDFDHIYQSLWAAIGNFIPLIMLLFCNIGLMREVHKSYAMRKTLGGSRRVKRDDASANRITVTLVAIVVMFLVLVAPSEVMKQVAELLGGDYSSNETYRVIEIIYNLLQTLNFSANFVLYCVINPSFRKTMRERFCIHYKKLNSGAFEASFMDCTYRHRFSSTMRMNSMDTQRQRQSEGLSPQKSADLIPSVLKPKRAVITPVVSD